MKKLFLSLFIFSFALFSASAFSEKDIISPSAGTWCNQQALVLAPSDASEVYYSFTGCDPFESGFAYDGPVLLDVEGDVTLKIAKVISRTKKEYVEVKYKVNCDDSAAASYGSFISTFYDTGVSVDYNDKLLTLQTCVENHSELREIVLLKEVSRTSYN